MRMHLPLLALAAVAATFPAQAATRNFGVTSFERIRVEGPMKVQLTTGVAPFARASGSQAALDRVAIEVMGTTLIIHNKVSSWGSYSDSDDVGPVEIQVGTHDLSSAILTGAGSLQIDKAKALTFNASVEGSGLLGIGSADVDQLSVNIMGTANSVIGGRAGMLKLSTRGVSAFDGSALATKDATISANGAATIKAKVTNSAKLEAFGPASIVLTGNPACSSKLSGAASVSGCHASR